MSLAQGSPYWCHHHVEQQGESSLGRVAERGTGPLVGKTGVLVLQFGLYLGMVGTSNFQGSDHYLRLWRAWGFAEGGLGMVRIWEAMVSPQYMYFFT